MNKNERNLNNQSSKLVRHKMKLSTFLPILTAAEKHKKDGKSVDRVNFSAITNECTNQVASLGQGTFETTNDGFRGEINLDNYPDNVLCKHVVQANSRCSEIKIQYRKVNVEADRWSCWDKFRFGWDSVNGFEFAEPECGCFGESCQSLGLPLITGPDSFLINSNTFSFFFHSDWSENGGHVFIDWECTEVADTTTTTSTTSTTTTTSTMTTM